jgi:hypothetical protein
MAVEGLSSHEILPAVHAGQAKTGPPVPRFVAIQTPRNFYPFRARVSISEPAGLYWLPHVASSTFREPNSPAEPDLNKNIAMFE